ncbi:hypothetical protein KM043_011504 [Ampulex compressa]|nr:hypothetical protein KM043_011504 [Ampulex compressa]
MGPENFSTATPLFHARRTGVNNNCIRKKSREQRGAARYTRKGDARCEEEGRSSERERESCETSGAGGYQEPRRTYIKLVQKGMVRYASAASAAIMYSPVTAVPHFPDVQAGLWDSPAKTAGGIKILINPVTRPPCRRPASMGFEPGAKPDTKIAEETGESSILDFYSRYYYSLLACHPSPLTLATSLDFASAVNAARARKK